MAQASLGVAAPVTLFRPDQLAVAKAIRRACFTLGYGQYPNVLAALCCALDEQSLRWDTSTDGHQGSAYGYQQGDGYGSMADRSSILTGTSMFLEGRAKGNGGDEKLGYLQTDLDRSIPYRIQDVQQSEFDGKTPNPKTGLPYPFAQNYIDAMPAAIDVLAQIGDSPMALPDAGDAAILRAAGLTVIELSGWSTRGEDDGGFDPIGILLHHDGMGLGFDQDPSNDMNVPEYMSQNGVGGAQKWVKRTGEWVMLAAGRKWHAGTGIGYGQIGRDQGNTLMDGVETDHTTGDPWVPVQVASINLGCAALVQAHGYPVGNCCGHKEYTRDTGRKPDPENFDCDHWRAQLSRPLSELLAEYRAALGITPPTGDLAMDAEVTAAFKVVNDKVDKLTKLITDAVGDGQASFASTIKALLHLVQGDQNLDAQDLKVDQAGLAQQQANANALNRVEKQTAAKPVVTIAPAPGPVA